MSTRVEKPQETTNGDSMPHITSEQQIHVPDDASPIAAEVAEGINDDPQLLRHHEIVAGVQRAHRRDPDARRALLLARRNNFMILRRAGVQVDL